MDGRVKMATTIKGQSQQSQHNQQGFVNDRLDQRIVDMRDNEYSHDDDDVDDEGNVESPQKATGTQYDVEHLATFSTGSSQVASIGLATSGHDGGGGNGNNNSDVPLDSINVGEPVATNLNKSNNEQKQQQAGVTEPRVALQRLFELEKLSGIWTQRMQIVLQNDLMLIYDCETNSIVERFHRDCVSQPEAFNQYNDIYNNIIVFIINQQQQQNEEPDTSLKPNYQQTADKKQQSNKCSVADIEDGSICDNTISTSDKTTTITSEGELHIFQCVSHRAKQLVADIVAWKSANCEPISHQATNEQSQSTEANDDDKMKQMIRKTAKSSSDTAATKQNDIINSCEINNKRLESSTKNELQPDLGTNTTKQVTSISCNDKSQLKINPSTSSSTSCDAAIMTGKSSNQPMSKATATGGDANDGQAKQVAVTVASSSATSDSVPIVNVNVRETVQVFNQIAALREKGGSAGNNQTSSTTTTTTTTTTTSTTPARPLSSDALISPQPNGQNGDSRDTQVSALSPGGQFYKQRSIRATLAAKVCANDKSKAASSASSSASAFDSDHKAQNRSKQPVEATAANSSSSISAASSSSASSRSDGYLKKHNHSHQQGTGQLAMSSNHPKKRNSTDFIHQTNSTATTVDPIKQTNGNAYTQSNSYSSSSSASGHYQQAGKQLHNNTKEQTKVQQTAQSKVTQNARPKSLQQQVASNNGNNHDGSSLYHHHQHSSSDSSQRSHGSPSSQRSLTQQQLDQVTTNESYVSVLNHCFDDIEKFIIRLQQAYAASRQLHQARRRQSKKSDQTGNSQTGNKLANGHYKAQLDEHHQAQLPAPLTAAELAHLSAQARGPNSEDFFEILSKFKLAFNLLAKLKGCIHEPNAPELVHFLFTPLAIIIESARNVTPPVDPTVVGVPYLNKDALDLLSNCCTSKESDLWLSLGPNWTHTIEPSLLKASRLPSSFQPIFSDGWTPVINELELIGLVVAPVESAVDHYRSSQAFGVVPRPPPLQAPLVRDQKLDKPSLLLSSSSSSSTSKKGHHHQQALNKGTSLRLSNDESSLAPSSKVHHLRKHANSPTSMGKHTFLDINQQNSTAYLHDIPVDVYDVTNPYRQPSTHRIEPHVVHEQTNSTRRKSEYQSRAYAMGHFSPPMMAANNSAYHVGAMLHEDSSYQSNLPPSFSDDYTELHEDHVAVNQTSRERRRQLGVEYLDYDPIERPDRVIMSDPYGNGVGSRGRFLVQEQLVVGQSRLHPNQVYFDEMEREAMLLDLGPAQTEWFYELLSRGALIVRVLFSREANNDKELTVKRGEILEILDDSRKWWKARNIDLQEAFVPHTIVAFMDRHQTLDELLTNSPRDMILVQGHEQALKSSQHRHLHDRRQSQNGNVTDDYNSEFRTEDRRNPKASRGAFRYF